MSRENVDALRAVYEEYSRGNFRAGVDLYDPHAVSYTHLTLPTTPYV